MLRFRGSPALSPFRLEKLLTALRRRVPVVTEIYAEFIHFVDGRLITHDREVLDRLLQYGPTATQRHLTSEPTFLVVPRPGTRSPWSSKATDIARNCGLQHVRRIEREFKPARTPAWRKAEYARWQAAVRMVMGG